MNLFTAGSRRRFLEIFSAQSLPNGLRLNSNESKNHTFIKYVMVFLARAIDVTISVGALFKLWFQSKYSHMVLH